ncbi:MAG: Appr-1-p processing protein [Vulcanimicrobiota bacterium]
MLIYRAGDVTTPVANGPAIIAQVCNDSGVWEGGLTTALSARWPEPERAYLKWYEDRLWEEEPFGLGALQTVRVGPLLQVSSIVAEHGLLPHEGVPPIRYGALETALHKLLRVALKDNSSIHIPRIGTGSAGGDWARIERLLAKMLHPVELNIYDFPT